MGYTCGICGRVHDELPMDLAHRRPGHIFRVPEEEWSRRVYLTDDLCVIDDREFLIRGVLPLPVKGSDQEFRWGTWALVDQQDFTRYLELWEDDEGRQGPFPGWLSGGIRDYADSDMFEVQVQPQRQGQRPRFEVISQEHPLGIDQRQGITMERVHEFVADVIAAQ